MKKVKNEVALEVTKGHSLNVNLFDQDLGRMGSYSLQHTNHSEIRSNQRGISNMIITLAIEYGKVIYRQGLEFHVMGDRNIPNWIDNNLKKKIRNTVVVLSPEAQIVTCYKGSNAMRHVNRKQKYLAAA